MSHAKQPYAQLIERLKILVFGELTGFRSSSTCDKYHKPLDNIIISQKMIGSI